MLSSSSSFCLIMPLYLYDEFAVWFCGAFFKLTKEQQQLLQQNKPFMLQVTAHSCEPFGLMPAFAVHGPLV